MKTSQIPVVILCGGKGSRFREMTELRPKPMIEVGGEPILLHIMRWYAHHGFRRFVLALGYKGTFIKNYFLNYRFEHSDFTVSLNPNEEPKFHTRLPEDWEITCVDTGAETLKGARVKKLEDYLTEDRFHLTYGDGVCNVDVGALDKFHCDHGKLATLTAVHPPSRFGELQMEGDQVLNFEEKPQMQTGHINGGFFVLKKDFLKHLTRDEDCDLEFGALEKVAKQGELRAYRHNDFWQCMDNVRDREYLEKLWNSGQAPWSAQ